MKKKSLNKNNYPQKLNYNNGNVNMKLFRMIIIIYSNN